MGKTGGIKIGRSSFYNIVKDATSSGCNTLTRHVIVYSPRDNCVTYNLKYI